MGRLEAEFAGLQAQVEAAQRSAKALAAALGKLRTAAQSGNVVEIERNLATLGSRADETASLVATLRAVWNFDARGYMADGFSEELQEAARAAGINLIEVDGRLSIFPVLLRLDAKEPALRIGKRAERRLRPSVLAKVLADVQRRPQRFNEQRFLELLYRAYVFICGREWDGSARGPLKELGAIHGVLTLLPDVDYPIEEFGRDLLLLDRRPELRTRSGSRPVFDASSIARTSAKRINVFDEAGQQKIYVGISFVMGE